jgi:hypothetical protein
MLVLASAFILRSESRGTHDHILLSQIRDFPNLEVQGPIFIFPRNRVAGLYPQALGSLFVASYDPQGYYGGIRPRLHTGMLYYRCVRAAFIGLRFDFLSLSEVVEVTTSLIGGTQESLSHGFTVVSMYKKHRPVTVLPPYTPIVKSLNTGPAPLLASLPL